MRCLTRPMIYPDWITLKWTMLLLGALLVVMHALALAKPDAVQGWLKKFPRNYEIGVFLTIGVTAWFYLMVKWMDLGEFDKWRDPVLVITPIAGILAIFFMRDFLAVRALGTMVLLLAMPLLESAFMRPEMIRLTLVTLVYVWVFVAMFWVGMPYTLRDQISWVSATPQRWRTSALVGLAYGAILCVGGMVVPSGRPVSSMQAGS
jgi:hypothetical protein